MPRSRQVAICLLRLAVGGMGVGAGGPATGTPARSPETRGAWECYSNKTSATVSWGPHRCLINIHSAIVIKVL